MARYAGNEEFDFSLFENSAARKVPLGSAAPELEPEVKTVKRPASPKKTEKAGTLQPWARLVVVILVSAVLVGCFSVPLYLRAENDRLTEEIADIQKEISIERNNSKTLDNRIDAMFTKKEVEAYAENVLGMIKLDSYNTIELKLPRANEVVISGGRRMSGMVETNNIFAAADADS